MLDRRSFLCSTAAAFSVRSAFGEMTGTGDVIDGVFRLADGRVLAYQQYGDPAGAPAFYFHGMPGSRMEAGIVADEAAATGVRLISIDRPGIGGSSYQSCRRVTDWPADVSQLADALPGFEGFSVVGVSGGAPFALACANQLAGRVKHTALVSGHAPFGIPGLVPGNQDQMVSLVARRPCLAKLLMNLLRRRLNKRPDKVMARLTAAWSYADRNLVLSDPRTRNLFIQNLRLALRCPGGLAHDVGLLARPWGFSVSEVRSPVTIWQGTQDGVVPPSMGHYFHQELENSQLFINDASSHVTTVKWDAMQWLSKLV